MRDQVQEIKDKIDITTVVGERVELVKAGRNLKGRCPFHNERTPSFMVNPTLQIFKCFGCGESGDVLTFLQKYEGMEFPEALGYLAERTGVELKTRISGEDREKKEIMAALALAGKFYAYILKEHKEGERGREYLASRGMRRETVEAFALGVGANGGDRLSRYMSRKGFSAETLEKAGLSIKGPRGFYDRFRDRIMFPITDARGKIIAFGGRILPEKDDGKQGKYINSPDSLVYNKSESLYGLSVTKGDIGRARSAVVVEGEFDLLSSWQSGVRGIVAIKGSALTVGQVNLIGRYADKLVMALDSDFAGQEAAVKGIEAAKNSGLDVVVARIPAEYKDPDEFASADPTGWTTAVRDATDVWSFMIDVLFAKYKGLTGSQKAKIGVEAAKILNRISDEIERIHYTKDVAERLAVPFEVLAKRLSTNSLSRAQEPHFAPVSLGEVAADRRTLLEERLIALAFSSEPKLLLERDLVQHIKTPLARRIVNFYEDYEPQGDWDVAEFARNLPEELYGGFAALVTLEEDDVSLANELHEVIHELHELVLKSQINELSKKIAESERDADESGLLEAQKEFAKVSVKLTEFEREIP